MDNNVVQAFKNEISIEKVLKELCLDYDIAGEDAVLICPFHEEKLGSFRINLESGLHHCFGCGQSGSDIVAFIRAYKTLGFVQALELLSELTGVPLPKNIEDIDKGNLVKRKLLHMKESYLAEGLDIDYTPVYDFLLNLCSRDKAVEYLHSRGILHADRVVDSMRVRVLDDYDRINNELLNHFSLRRLIQAGIVTERKNLIFLSHRLLFPFKYDNSLIYMTARSFDNVTKPKYLNLRDRTIPNFYNVDAVLNNDTVFVCEGITDTLALVGAGLPAVGIAGASNINSKVLEILQDKNVIIAFDNDKAGEQGKRKLLDTLKYIANSVRVYEKEEKDILDHLQTQKNRDRIKEFYNNIRVLK